MKPLPEPVDRSPLMQSGGFQIFEGLPDPRLFAAMLAEAENQWPSAEANWSVTEHPEERGGAPPRKLRVAPGGDAQTSLYHSPRLADLLRSLLGMPVVPSASVGAYSYYLSPGDHLALHRDVEDCDLAVITCLLQRHRAEGHGGSLCLYPRRMLEPLRRIRRTPFQGLVQVNLRPSQSIVMLGGYVPHAVLPLAAGEARVISAICYHFDLQDRVSASLGPGR